MRYLTVILLSLFMLTSFELFAQSAERDEDRFFYGSETDEDLQAVMPQKSFESQGIQYGAIISPVYLYEKEGDSSLSSAVLNSKVWGKAYLWQNSYLYVGVKDSYLKVLSSKGSLYEDTESDNVVDLDQAFISMSGNDGSLRFAAGRKYFNIGTGLVLNGRGDGAELNYTKAVFSLNLMGLYTGFLIKDNNPYGLSDKDFSDGAERIFSGGVLSAAAGNQQIYMFGLVQIDRAKEESSEETRYNSQYYGAGFEGVILNDVSYYAEAIFETGESYVTGVAGNEKTNIAAYAANTGLNYFIPLMFNPTLILQYAYGSGDKCRNDYTTSNRPSGSDGYDKGFISFGTYSGGYALQPVLSNMHVFRAGITFVPFAASDSMAMRKFSLGTKYSYYMKDEKNSRINDGEAALPESDIGQGIDVSVRWQIFYDASFYVNYGLFLPGAAYEEKNSKNFVMSGFNFSF